MPSRLAASERGCNRYILFSFDLAASATWDVTQIDGIAGFISLPMGWTYSSRVTTQDEVYASGGIADVFAMGAPRHSSWFRSQARRY